MILLGVLFDPWRACQFWARNDRVIDGTVVALPIDMKWATAISEARTWAAYAREANAMGFDFGIEQDAFGFRAFMLPRRENRYGHETRCEVVMCETLTACQPGHGPATARH